MFLDVFRCFQMSSDVFRCFQMFSDVFICYQDALRCSQNFYRCFQMPGGSCGSCGSGGSSEFCGSCESDGLGVVDCPTQLTLICIFWFLYLSVVCHNLQNFANCGPGNDDKFFCVSQFVKFCKL